MDYIEEYRRLNKNLKNAKTTAEIIALLKKHREKRSEFYKMKNIWILAEERPKNNVIHTLVKRLAEDYKLKVKINRIKIRPILTKDKRFDFTYIVEGIRIIGVGSIYIKMVSGNSSFVDFLVFYQEDEPDMKSIPVYAIEETKTDDSESRNTGAYQRSSKFVFINFYYPKVKKIMLYNLRISQKEKPTETNIFGTRMLLTLGVEILGKNLDKKIFKPFKNLKEMISLKDHMRKAPKGNVPIEIKDCGKRIEVSGRLIKSGHLSHDPNIGALTAISGSIRKWDKRPIVVTLHGLKQENIGKKNKFIMIANELNVGLKGLRVPKTELPKYYWHYEKNQEKIASIFIHLIVEAYTNGHAIYENHGGSERGYLYLKNGDPVTVEKYQKGKRELYKKGDKTAIIYIPDLILYDPDRKEVVNIEGKTYKNKKKGIAELDNYDYIEEEIIGPSYKPKSIKRTVVLNGSKNKEITEPEVSFLLNEEGEIIVGEGAPAIIKEAIKKLRSS